MKRTGMLGTVIRRNGSGFRWLVRDRLGGVIDYGIAPRYAQAVQTANERKLQLIAQHPSFSEQAHKSIRAKHSIWAAKHKK